MTSTKAVAGGVGAYLATIAMWLLTLIPGWAEIPEEPKAAISALVIAGIGYGLVYWSPANRHTIDPGDPPHTSA